MVGRVQRVLSWFVLVMAVGTIVVALLELDRRSGEEDVALPPTAVPSPVVTLPPTSPEVAEESPDVPGTPAETQPLPTPTPAGPAPAAPTATIAPPPTPSPAPLVPTPSPRVGAAGVEPMPETGGGAVPAGMVVTIVGLGLSYLARRAY